MNAEREKKRRNRKDDKHDMQLYGNPAPAKARIMDRERKIENSFSFFVVLGL